MTTRRRRSKRARITGPSGDPLLPTPLPLPSASDPVLDLDVSRHILSFLDGESFIASSCVSRSFRNAIIPHQKNVSIGNFQSYSSMKQMGFTGAVFFHGMGSDLVTNEVLSDLAASFPSLRGVDLSGCQNINVNGVRSLVSGLGSRLEKFILDQPKNTIFMTRRGEIRVTDAIIKVVAGSPSLQTVKLILPSKCKDQSLMPLDGKASLRSLSLKLCGISPINLPRALPQLEHLEIETEYYSGFDWTALLTAEYPSLKSMTIINRCYKFVPYSGTISAEVLIAFLSRAPNFEKLCIYSLYSASKLRAEKASQEPLLKSFLISRNIEYEGPVIFDPQSKRRRRSTAEDLLSGPAP